jgi:Uma2 family endonuclease
MSSAQPKIFLTPEEYLVLERKAERKSEYFGGEMFAIGGASKEHNLIVANVIIALGVQLKKRPCEVYPSDMRVKVSDTGLYTYPDVVVVCGEPQFDSAFAEQKDTLLNPIVIVEVLSDSTEQYDRGKKFSYYRRIASLAEYLLIAQDECRVEQYVRQSDGRWLLSETSNLADTIVLSSINCQIALKEIYDKVI